MIRIFRTNRPIVFLYLLLVTLVFKGAFLLFPAIANHGTDSFIAPYFLHLVQSQHIELWTLQLADIFLVYLEAVILNFLLAGSSIIERSSFVPAFIFIIISSLFGEWVIVHLETVATLFLFFSLYNLFALSGKEIGKDNIFYTSLYLSIGSFFYFPVALFLPVILFTLLLRRYSFFDFLLTIIGFLVPYFFLGIFYYYEGFLADYLLRLQMVYYPKPMLTMGIDIGQIILLVYVLLLAVIGYFSMAADMGMKIVKLRRLVYIMIAFLLVVVLATPFVTGSRLLYLQLITIPATVFISRFLDRERPGVLRSVLLALLIAGAAFFQLYYFKIL